jgi:hypothetical protein
MDPLARITLILGALLLGWHLILSLTPNRAGAWLLGFPRNKWAGYLLAAGAVGWSTLLVWQAEVAWLERFRLPLCILAPVILALIVVFADELLAPRALGGLLLLIPLPILEAAFLYPGRSRLLMTGFAYLLVILGMVLVWSPYLFRKMTAPWAGKPNACRRVGLAGIALGLGLLLLGWLVYR